MDEQLNSLLAEGKIDSLRQFQKKFSTSSVTITRMSLIISEDTFNDVKIICDNIVNEKYGSKFCNPYHMAKNYTYQHKLVYVVKKPIFDVLYNNTRVDNPDLLEIEFAKISDDEYDAELVNLKYSLEDDDRIIDTIYVKEKVWNGDYTLIINLSEKNITSNIRHIEDILHLTKNGVR